MERHADNIADLYEHHSRPAAGDTLAEAVWFEEQSLGYPLNLMCSLYYESTPGDSFRPPAEAEAPGNAETQIPDPDKHHE